MKLFLTLEEKNLFDILSNMQLPRFERGRGGRFCFRNIEPQVSEMPNGRSIWGALSEKLLEVGILKKNGSGNHGQIFEVSEDNFLRAMYEDDYSIEVVIIDNNDIRERIDQLESKYLSMEARRLELLTLIKKEKRTAKGKSISAGRLKAKISRLNEELEEMLSEISGSEMYISDLEEEFSNIENMKPKEIISAIELVKNSGPEELIKLRSLFKLVFAA